MDRDEILNMEAGKELNKQVAISVMEYGEKPVLWAKYSENISAAWLVVEKMEGTIGDNDVNLQTVVRGWRCTISSRGKEYSSSAETAPLAICRAALLAVNGGV